MRCSGPSPRDHLPHSMQQPMSDAWTSYNVISSCTCVYVTDAQANSILNCSLYLTSLQSAQPFSVAICCKSTSDMCKVNFQIQGSCLDCPRI